MEVIQDLTKNGAIQGDPKEILKSFQADTGLNQALVNGSLEVGKLELQNVTQTTDSFLQDILGETSALEASLTDHNGSLKSANPNTP